MRQAETSKYAKDMAQDSAQSSVEISVLGVFGEYAAAKALNLFFDVNTAYRNFGPDLVSRKGNKIDVKSTKRKGGNLNAVHWSKNKPTDIYVLTEVCLPFVNVVGWIHRDTFLVDENLVHRDDRAPYYSVPQSALSPINGA